MNVSRYITFKDIDPSVVFGPHDIFLKKIEENFPNCFFVSRGEMLQVRGSSKDVEFVRHITSNMISFIQQNGQINVDELESIIFSVMNNMKSRRSVSNDVVIVNRNVVIKAKTTSQQELFSAAQTHDISFAIGPAGTGKTFISIAIAVAALKEKVVQKLILARPAIEAGENLGFLPGEISQKIEPYLKPLYDAIEYVLPQEKIKEYFEKKIIEVVPLAFMRGRTFSNAYMLLDEAQNATSMQMKMFITRLGQHSKAIIMGDISQTDLPSSQVSGLTEAVTLFKSIKGISFTYFDKTDVLRHKIVRDVIAAYEKKSK